MRHAILSWVCLLVHEDNNSCAVRVSWVHTYLTEHIESEAGQGLAQERLSTLGCMLGEQGL